MFEVIYQVDIRQDGRWSTTALWERESDGRRQVAALIRAPGLDGVRLLRVRTSKVSGREYTSTLEDHDLSDRPQALGVGTVPSAGLCERIEDFDRLSSRLVMNRALRGWLDREQVTVTELICLPKLQKRLEQAEGLMFTVIATVAQAQARSLQVDTKAQVAALSKLVQQGMTRARQSGVSAFPGIDEAGLAKLGAGIVAKVPAGDRGFTMTAAIARDLAQRPHLAAKLDRLLDLAALEPDDLAIRAIDSAVADILASGQVLQDILGQQTDLATALGILLDLAAGRLPTEGPAAKAAAAPDSPLPRLATLLATGIADESRHVLIDRVSRELGGTQPLVKQGDPWVPLRRLADRAFGDLGDGASPDLAMGVIDRTARLLNIGGQAGEAAAIARIGSLFDRDWEAIRFLLALTRSPMSDRHPAAVKKAAGDLLPALASPATLLFWMEDPAEKRQALQGLRREIEAMATRLGESEIILSALDRAIARLDG